MRQARIYSLNCCLKAAEYVLASFKKVHKILKNTFSTPVKRLHTDNGGEYDNDMMKEYLAEEGIELTTTAPYNPRSNGVAECANRTVMKKVRAILSRSNLWFEYWPDAVSQVTYLHNRTPATNSGGVTPYQKDFGRISSLDNIRIFGCFAYAKVPDEKRKKLFEKSVKCALLQCLPEIQYRVWDLDNGDIYCVRDAKFDVTKFPFFGSRQGKFIRIGDEIFGGKGSGPETCSEYNPDDDNHSGNDSDDDYYGPDDEVNKETLISNRAQALHETPPNSPPPAGTPIDDDDYDDDAPLLPPPADENADSGGEATEQVSSRPQRIRKAVDPYKSVHLANAKAATYDTPTFHDAMIRDDADLWKEVITKEINFLKERGTWELGDQPQNARVLPSKVVLKIKRCPDCTIDRYKARLVALGCLQMQSDYDETFSPVVDLSTVRSALTLAVYDKEHVHHIDVTGAFLYGHLSKPLYMTSPEGFEVGSRKICKLKKSIYGLEQAPRIWHQHLREHCLS
jgi:Reverse transcriptase (RNA-dependent DNA polymerase)